LPSIGSNAIPAGFLKSPFVPVPFEEPGTPGLPATVTVAPGDEDDDGETVGLGLGLGLELDVTS
jgi:hypothetical protein